MSERERKKINAVHENDLDLLLEKFGIKEFFLENKMKCKFCAKTVNKENIYSFLPESGMTNVICDDPKCILKLIEYLKEKKKGKVVE